MEVTMSMSEYEELRDSQIPHTVKTVGNKTLVSVSKNTIIQLLALKYEEDTLTLHSGSYTYSAGRQKEVDVVFDD